MLPMRILMVSALEVWALSGQGGAPSLFKTLEGLSRRGHEVDFVVEHGTELIPIEVKASSTPRIEMSRGIEILHQQLPRKAVQGFLVHTGSEALEWNARVRTLPASAL